MAIFEKVKMYQMFWRFKSENEWTLTKARWASTSECRESFADPTAIEIKRLEESVIEYTDGLPVEEE